MIMKNINPAGFYTYDEAKWKMKRRPKINILVPLTLAFQNTF
jgi:hypothetical protein